MGRRHTVTSANEDAEIADFLEWYNLKYGASFEVESRPDPPDAILRDRDTGITTWVELTNAYYSAEWARDVHSHATAGRENFEMGHIHEDMDKKTADNFVCISMKKLNSSSYDSVAEQYGMGILVVVVHSPWFDDQTVEEMENAWNEKDVENTSGNIGRMFYGWRFKGGYDFREWDLLE